MINTPCYIPATWVWSLSVRPKNSDRSQSNSSIHLFCHQHGPPHKCLIFVCAVLSESNVYSKPCSVVSKTVGRLVAHLSASRIMEVWWRASPGHSHTITILKLCLPFLSRRFLYFVQSGACNILVALSLSHLCLFELTPLSLSLYEVTHHNNHNRCCIS